jgi:tetratricopeptide (TPR) repeat protein
MTVPASTTSGPKARRGWRRLLVCAAVLVVLGLGALGLWFYVLGPQPPEVYTAEDGPGVAEDIAEARGKVRLWPFSADAWGNLGIVLQYYAYIEEAGTCYARAAQLAPRSPRWPYLQAVIQLRSDLEAALPLLERSVRLGGEVQTPRLVLGESLLLRNRSEEAEGYFRQVLEVEPNNARALLGLGRAAYQRGDLASARAFLERSIAANPRVRATHALLAQVYHRQNDAKRAVAARAAAAELPEQATWPDPYRVGSLSQLRGESAAVFRATTLRQQGQAKEALAMLKEASQRYPQSQRIFRALGRTHVALEDYAAAEAAYRQAIRLQPDSLESQYECGLVLAHQGNRRGAAECFRQALRLRPDYGEAHYQLGRCLEILARDDDAIAAYRQAVRYQPDLVAAHQALGALLAIKQEDAEARKVLQHALDLDPSHEQTRQHLAAVRKRMKAP